RPDERVDDGAERYSSGAARVHCEDSLFLPLSIVANVLPCKSEWWEGSSPCGTGRAQDLGRECHRGRGGGGGEAVPAGPLVVPWDIPWGLLGTRDLWYEAEVFAR